VTSNIEIASTFQSISPLRNNKIVEHVFHHAIHYTRSEYIISTISYTDSTCKITFKSTGNLYENNWGKHQSRIYKSKQLPFIHNNFWLESFRTK